MGTAQNSFLYYPVTLPCDGLNCYWSHQHNRLAHCIHPIAGCMSPSIENALDRFSDGAACTMGWMRRATRPHCHAPVCPHPNNTIPPEKINLFGQRFQAEGQEEKWEKFDFTLCVTEHAPWSLVRQWWQSSNIRCQVNRRYTVDKLEKHVDFTGVPCEQSVGECKFLKLNAVCKVTPMRGCVSDLWCIAATVRLHRSLTVRWHYGSSAAQHRA